MENGIIYKATSPSGKVYIGQTIYTLKYRRRAHIGNSNNKKHRLYNSKFYRAIRKYKDLIDWEIIQRAPRDKLNIIERKEVAKYNSYRLGYNSDLGGNVRSKDQLKKQARRGERHHFAKISRKIVGEMRSVYSRGEHTYADIAEIFGHVISSQAVGKIVRNERWETSDNVVKKNEYSGVGERNSHAKLNREDVICIRNKYSLGNYTHRELAEEYGVKEPAIYKIINKLTWKNI